MNFRERAEQFVDQYAAHHDAQYRATVETFRRWLEMTEMAMADEDVPSDVRGRVLNRLLFGTPSGADAYERIERRKRDIEIAMTAPVNLAVIKGSLGLGQP